MLRDFVARAEAIGIDYNIIEAFDQPWKTNEGGVGMYWGMFDAARKPKFAWTGPVSDPDHWKVAGLAVLLGLLLSLPILARSRARPPARRSCWRSPPTWSAPGSRPCSPSGTATISCPARPSRSVSASLLLVPLVADRAGAHRGDRGDRVRPQARAA